MVPVPVGAVNETVKDEDVAVPAETPVGAEAIVVTEADAVDGADVPPEFVAVTVNVYGVFEVNPVIEMGLAEPVAVILPGLLVTV
jgi:hypothetical protein